MDPSRLAALTFVIASALPIAAGQDRPPTAPVRPVTDTYFGTSIVDPYRWMEDTKSPELTAWMAAQNRYTRSVLDGLPLRRELLERIGSLSGAADDLSFVTMVGGKYFTVKIAAGQNQPKVYVRDGLAGAERVLIDPETLSSDGRRYSITYFAPSQDGRYVAYGTAAGGSGDAVLRVIETATGQDMGERIDRTDLGNPSWLPDGRSFFYHRRQPQPPGAPPAARFQNARVFLHRLGDDPDNDIPVFGSNVSPLVALDPALMASVTTVSGSSVMFAHVVADIRFRRTYAAPLASIRESPIPWSLVVDVPDQVTAIDVHGDDLYLLTSRDAPRRKIVRTSLARPNLAAAQTIVPESEAVITSMDVARDALYVQTLDGGLRRLSRVGFAGGPLQRLPLPYEASASRAMTNPREPGALFRLASWTKSPAWFRYDPSSDRVTDTKLLPASPVDFSGIESLRVHVRSYDGTMVPLSIVFSRSVKRDGSNPTLLGGYGAYGSVTDPAFRPRRLAWLERGGVYAFAHVRGGGDYGEEWHRAGQKLNKMNSVRDFIACAEFLIKEGFTSPAHLAGEGSSAGATVIGRAITERPDLFAAAISDRGGLNMLRLEAEPNGPPNVPEFGSVKTPDGFKGLLAIDVYHHIKDGTPYPAVLLLTADNDARVAPWQSAKTTARLQAASTSGKPVLLRIESDAGHGFSTQDQRVEELADTWTFLFWQLGAGTPRRR
jgi:prolyl oligopeptidase